MLRYMLLVMFSWLFIGTYSTDAWAAKCLFVSSYHPGYAWADGIERGVRRVLDGKCDLKQINMDTKRYHTEGYLLNKGLEVKRIIDDWQPDVVIVADDNASKYVLVPYFKDADIPFVFCGINWSVEEYGFPYKNVTGMIEVDPIRSIFKAITETVPGAQHGYYIGANTLTEHKSFKRFDKMARQQGYTLEPRLVDSMAQWVAAFREAQAGDFIIIGTKSGIADWRDDLAYDTVSREGGKTSITNYEWMTRFSLLGMTKVPEEHGEWAAQVALDILNGLSPAKIPIIPSRKWDMYVNYDLMAEYGIRLPQSILDKSKKVYGFR